MRVAAGLLVWLALGFPAAGQAVEGWILLSDGTRVEGSFGCDRRRVTLRDVEVGSPEHVAVEDLRRLRVWVVEERVQPGRREEGDVLLLGREYVAEIETADGSWRYAPIELRLRHGQGREARSYQLTRLARGTFVEGRPSDHPFVVQAAFGPAAGAGDPPPRLSGGLDPAGGWHRVFAVRRESNLAVEGQVEPGGTAYRFPWLYPGTWDLVLVGRVHVALWLEPEVSRGLGPEEEPEEIEDWMKRLAVHEEDAAGGREIRHALARGRPEAARAVVLESRWRSLHEGGGPVRIFTERVYRIWLGHRAGEAWQIDRALELDRVVEEGGVEAPLKLVELDRAMSGIRVGRDRTPTRRDFPERESR